MLSVDVYAAMIGVVDPSDLALPFAGLGISRDYETGTFDQVVLRLSDFVLAGEVTHFAVFGTWCPACMPAIASMVSDVDRQLPDGAVFFLID